MIDPIVSIWDSMAIIPIIRGAGGVIKDYQGNDPIEGSDLIASNGDLQAKIISILNSPV
jgi:fructose-1,6-bisphosphatase/inositol monophosphatase family enzyme